MDRRGFRFLCAAQLVDKYWIFSRAFLLTRHLISLEISSVLGKKMIYIKNSEYSGHSGTFGDIWGHSETFGDIWEIRGHWGHNKRLRENHCLKLKSTVPFSLLALQQHLLTE